MGLIEYLHILRKYWISASVVAASTLLAAGLFCLFSRPTYTAATSVFVTVQTATTAGELSAGSLYAENQVQSYARVAVAPIVLQPVIEELKLPTTPAQLAKRVTATAVINTAIIQLSVTDENADAAARIANAIAGHLIESVSQLSPASATGGKSTQATVIAPAAPPTEWTSPKILQILGLGALLGIILGAAQAVLRARFDTRVVDATDVARVTDSSIVGTIEFDANTSKPSMLIAGDTRGARSESYRRLRTNLQFLLVGDRTRSVVITSSIPGEGKTTTAINTASTLAAAGESVLLIDADLRRPAIADYLGLEGNAGLTTVLIGRASLEEVVQPVGEGDLLVLTAGQLPPNPSELLGSPAMAKLLEQAGARYDVVVIDSAPLLPVTDSAVLSKIAGGVLVVVGSGSVTRPQLQGALESLADVDCTVLGLVLNKVHVERAGYAQYGYVTEEPSVPVGEVAQLQQMLQHAEGIHAPSLVG